MELSVKHLRQKKLNFQHFQHNSQHNLSQKLAGNKNHNLKYWVVAGTFVTGVWQTALPSMASSSPKPKSVDNKTQSDIDEEIIAATSASENTSKTIKVSPLQTSENISEAEFSSSNFAIALVEIQENNIEQIKDKDIFVSEKYLNDTLPVEKWEESPTFSTSTSPRIDNANFDSSTSPKPAASPYFLKKRNNSHLLYWDRDKALRDRKGSKVVNVQCPIPNCPQNHLNSSQEKGFIITVNKTEKIENNIDFITELTSVSELSDVKSTDWAYQALKTIIERYGVFSGFPDRSFRGKSAISRDEFAAALLATINKLEDLLAESLGNEYIQQDMIVVRRLQKDYKNILEKLRKRLKKIDQDISDLEQQQFSLTTKLKGEQIFAFTDGSVANQTFISRTRLNFSTSFHQKDLLITQFESGNNGGDAIALQQQEDLNLLGVNGVIANGGGLDYGEVENDLRLRRLYYTFRPTKDTAISIGTKMSPRDFIDQNSYANNEAVDFSSSFFLNNPLIVQNQIDRSGGAGIAVIWKPKKQKFTVRSLYVAGKANQPNSNNSGLFGDPHQASLEVEYIASKKLKFRFQYTNAVVNNTDINALGMNIEYVLNRNTGIFTRLGYGNYKGFNTALNRDLDLHPVSWAIGLAIRNLFLPGATTGVALGQPFLSKGLGNSTQTNFEAFYNLQLTDNISVAPTFSLVNDADNDDSNGLIWQSTFRTVISF